MLSCKQASEVISQSLDRKLTAWERFNLKLHLLICKYCRYFSQQLQTLRVAVKANVYSIENDNTIGMSNEAKNRIAALVDTHPVQP
jgi:predicted anti-sigma-YlaC factor YlaD